MTVTRTKTGRIPMKAIRAVVDQIVERWHPDKIILFGSHAYGKPTIDSDVDLLVIMPVEGSNARAAGDICAKLQYEFPMDHIVRSPEKLARGLAIGDGFLRQILNAGHELYAAPRS